MKLPTRTDAAVVIVGAVKRPGTSAVNAHGQLLRNSGRFGGCTTVSPEVSTDGVSLKRLDT